MVDPIKGPGQKPIFTEKTQGKDKAEKTKEGEFDKRLASKDKTVNAEPPKAGQVRTAGDQTARLLQQQQLERMQRIAEITRQVQNGTYKMADPTVLADRLYRIMTDRKTREKFIKKVLAEEAETLKERGQPLTKLELKKLIYLVKNAADEEFSDPQLEALLKELS